MDRVNTWLQWDKSAPRNFVLCSVFPNDVLLLIRLGISAYCFVMLLFGFGYYSWNLGIFFRYYSDINYFLLVAYFLTVSIMHTFHRLGIGRQGSYMSDLNMTCNAQEKALWILFEIVLCNTFYVDVVYWLIIFPWQSEAMTAYFITSRALNSLFITIEILLNQIEVIPIHMIFSLLFGVLYMFYVWILFASTSTWVYDFLDWDNAITPFTYLMLLVMIGVFYMVGFGFSQARNKMFEWNNKRIATESFEELKKWETKSGFNPNAPNDVEDDNVNLI